MVVVSIQERARVSENGIPARVVGGPLCEGALSRGFENTDVFEETPWMDSRRPRDRAPSHGGQSPRTIPVATPLWALLGPEGAKTENGAVW